MVSSTNYRWHAMVILAHSRTSFPIRSSPCILSDRCHGLPKLIPAISHTRILVHRWPQDTTTKIIPCIEDFLLFVCSFLSNNAWNELSAYLFRNNQILYWRLKKMSFLSVDHQSPRARAILTHLKVLGLLPTTFFFLTRTMSLKLRPTLEEVQQIVAGGQGNTIPIYAEFEADYLTPVSAYLKVADRCDYSFLFESVAGGENIGRYSFIGAGKKLSETCSVGP